MKKFIVTKGLPGSGKSFFAVNFIKGKKDWVRINNDTISEMLFGDPFADGQSHVIKQVREDLVHKFMKKSKNIIIDNTNLHSDRIVEYKEMCERHNAALEKDQEAYTFEIKDFTDVPLNTCLERNRHRERKVPEHVIKDMYKRYIQKAWVPMTQDSSLPKAIIVDIDGTVANCEHRNPFDQTKAGDDDLIEHIANMVKLYHQNGYKIIYLSGREEKSRAVTTAWFKKHDLPLGELLLLNKDGEKRSSAITKIEIFDKHIKNNYYIELVLEDRWKNIEAWNKFGLMTLMVGGTHDNFF